MNDGLVGGMTAVPDEENDTVKLTLLGKTGTEIAPLYSRVVRRWR